MKYFLNKYASKEEKKDMIEEIISKIFCDEIIFAFF